MDAKEIADLLGRASDDALVESALARHSITDRPPLQRGPDAGPGVWLLNAEAGVEFGFEEEADFLGLPPDDRGAGPMLLTQVYLYGDHPNVVPYRGPLPFGLTLTDDRATVRRKLASHDARRRSYLRDAWALQSFTLVIAYAGGTGSIDFLLFLLPPPPSESASAVAPPSLDEIVARFGEPLSSAALAALLNPLGWASRADAVRRGGIVSLRRAHGIDLVGRPAAMMNPRSLAAGAGNVLTEVELFRDRALGASGWRGALPFGLRWDDSPEALMASAGRPPDETAETDFAGWALWHTPRFSVQAHFSTMENFIVRVRVIAPGVWAALGGG